MEPQHRLYRGLPCLAWQAKTETEVESVLGDVKVEPGDWILQYRKTNIRLVLGDAEYQQDTVPSPDEVVAHAPEVST